MEDASETLRPETLCPPGAALFLVYCLAALASYLLQVASHGLLVRAAGPCLPPPLPAAWFGHQAVTDVAFTVVLPLSLTRTPSGWPLGAAFCRLDRGLAFLTFYASGRLLARAAADGCASLLWVGWAAGHRQARRAVSWAGSFWLLLLVLGLQDLRAPRGRGDRAGPCNGTSAGEPPPFSSPALTQLVFGFGVPLGVLRASHSLLRARLRLAGLTGRPPLLGLPWASGAMLFLCWFPFHLLLLVRLLGTREAGLGMAEVWVLLRPLGLSLVGAGGGLNPLLYVGGARPSGGGCGRPSGPAQGEGLRRRQVGMEIQASWEPRGSFLRGRDRDKEGGGKGRGRPATGSTSGECERLT